MSFLMQQLSFKIINYLKPTKFLTGIFVVFNTQLYQTSGSELWPRN